MVRFRLVVQSRFARAADLRERSHRAVRLHRARLHRAQLRWAQWRWAQFYRARLRFYRARLRCFGPLGTHRVRRLPVVKSSPALAVPLSAVPFVAVPFTAVPFAAVPFTAVPFTAAPFTAEYALEFASWPNYLELPDSEGSEASV